MIEQETIKMFFWFALAVTMIVIALGAIYFFGIKNLNIMVG